MMSEWPYSYEPDDTSPETPDRSPSPRTDLLSPVYDGALERPTSRRRSVPRGPTERFRREREQVHSRSSNRDLIKALINEEYESKQTRRVLYKAYDQFQNETRRATEAEGRALEAAQRYRSLNESKILAQQEAVRVKEELRLYKLQLENAQKEIDKAQDILQTVEEQRDDAEASAARARDTARKLNEARLVEQAREEGRRLGFEEGIQRGRELGFDDGRNLDYGDGGTGMRAIPPGPVDRMLEGTYDTEYNRDNTPSGSPPRIITTPEVIRAPSPPPKDRTPLRTRKDSASSSRRGLPSPTPLPLSPPRRPVSLSNEPLSPRHLSGVTLPPDNWIPTADQAHFIAMPAPHGLQRTPEPMSTTSDADSIRSRTLGNVPSPSGLQHRSSLDSQASTNHSKASTALSQLDLVTPPHTTVGRNGRRGLSVIPEDTSSQRSPSGSIRDRSIHSDHRVPFQTPDLARAASDRDTGSPTQLQEARMRDKQLSQKMADELRYSDPNQVEEWRRNGIKEAQSRTNQDAPPRRRPSNLTIPSPLSPRDLPADPFPESSNSPGHRRTRSMTSASNHSLNAPSSRRNRKSTSSGSTVPEITIEPPSRPASEHQDRPGFVAAGLLSPDHAPNPLPNVEPQPSGPPLVPTVPNSPVIPSYIYKSLPDNNLPLGFTPIGPPTNALPPVASQEGPPIPDDGDAIPIPPPFSSSYSAGAGLSAAPFPGGGARESPSSRHRDLVSPIPNNGVLYPDVPPRSGSAMSKSSRSKTPRINAYESAPIPADVSYPQPMVINPSMSGGTAYHVPLPASVGSQSPGHRRSVSLNAGQTPSSLGRTKTLPNRAMTPKPSNSSLGSGKSHSHYDPDSHLDPAYFGSNDYHRDRVTEANTVANANGSRQSTSPALSYATLPAFS